jgi:hypothetical protein
MSDICFLFGRLTAGTQRTYRDANNSRTNAQQICAVEVRSSARLTNRPGIEPRVPLRR